MKYFEVDITLIVVNSYYSWSQVNLLPIKGVTRKQVFKVTLRSRFVFE